MFDLFSWSHILILLGVALVVVGPAELPRLMHMMGRWAGKARGMANEFKRSFDEMARQSELDELRKEVEALRTHNALSDVQNTLDETAAQMHSAPLEAAALVPGPPDEPRAGEFVVTDTSAAAPPPSAPAPPPPAPAPAPASEPRTP